MKKGKENIDRNEKNVRRRLSVSLRHIRRLLDWTQREYSDFVDVDRSQYQEIENGETSARIGTIAKLAAAIKVQPHVLLMPQRESKSLLTKAARRLPRFKAAQKERAARKSRKAARIKAQ